MNPYPLFQRSHDPLHIPGRASFIELTELDVIFLLTGSSGGIQLMPFSCMPTIGL